VLSAFLFWFREQTPATKRALVRERALAYLEHPLVRDVIAVSPPDIAEPAERLIEAIRRSDWKG